MQLAVHFQHVIQHSHYLSRHTTDCLAWICTCFFELPCQHIDIPLHYGLTAGWTGWCHPTSWAHHPHASSSDQPAADASFSVSSCPCEPYRTMGSRTWSTMKNTAVSCTLLFSAIFTANTAPTSTWLQTKNHSLARLYDHNIWPQFSANGKALLGK